VQAISPSIEEVCRKTLQDGKLNPEERITGSNRHEWIRDKTSPLTPRAQVQQKR
jgi:hypothetical protein